MQLHKILERMFSMFTSIKKYFFKPRKPESEVDLNDIKDINERKFWERYLACSEAQVQGFQIIVIEKLYLGNYDTRSQSEYVESSNHFSEEILNFARKNNCDTKLEKKKKAEVIKINGDKFLGDIAYYYITI